MEVVGGSSAFRLRWDVFISFRGEDTRHNFTKALFDSLGRHGVRAFLDDDGLRRGDDIAPSLVEAIEDSAAAVVVFSPNYADSRWCLEELVKISDCCGRRAMLVLPVFRGVDPSDVRKQRGEFGERFRVLVERFVEDVRVSRWRTALERIGGIAGWVFTPSEEEEGHIIKSLVKEVLRAVRKTPVGLVDYTVGIKSSVEELMNLLDLKSNGVRVLGLHGMGGIGKTTLAKALFNNLVGHGFRLRSFISNVREISAQEDGLELLHNQLVNDLSKDHNNNDQIGRALVVLDDVDNVTQLNALIVAKREIFPEGSRIIVTTRDIEALPGHIVNVKYEVRELNSDKALQLFSYHSLRREKPTDSLLSLSNQIVSLTGGLPLALEVFGSFLFDKRRVEEWKDALKKLKKIRPANLQDVLKISYDGLDEEAKCVFLDIACLFVSMGMERDYAIDVLKGCDFDAEIAISDLTAKSLIKITPDNNIWMHDQIRDMGRQIVKQESIVDPCMRSRLWNRDDITTVFLDDKRRKCTQGIVLNLKKKSEGKDDGGGTIAWNRLKRRPNLSNVLAYADEIYKEYKENQAEKKKEFVILAKAFGTMTNLRLLQVNYVNLQGDFKFPIELKWLQWKGCPLKYFPSDICAYGLAVLDLSESKIETLWGSNSNKVAENLKVLKLSGCYYLNTLPNLSSSLKLEKLFLKSCVRLTKIDESIGYLTTLVHLDLEQCKNLTKLPSDISGWKLLEILNVSGCSKLKELPNNIELMKSLKQILVDETAIESLPESIFHLTHLEILSLNRCRLLKQLPHCIGKLCSLKELSLNGSGLKELPGTIESLESLEKLNLRWCSSLSQLPDSIGNLKLLKEFSITGCPVKELPDSVGFLLNLNRLGMGKQKFLCALPCSLGRLESLVTLTINESSITDLPDQLGGLKSLKKLELRECSYLESLPNSIGTLLSLTSLTVDEAKIRDLPDSIGELENLTELILTFCRELSKLPESFGKLKSLNYLMMEETAVQELPQSFGMLSSLMVFLVPKINLLANDTKMPVNFFPTSFSNLSLLNKLDARERNITGAFPDDFEKLVSLENLNLSFNHFPSLPLSLRGLSKLKELHLYNCIELKSIPPLPLSLLRIDVSNCVALETISDLSNLERLEHLDITNCEKVVDIPGLESLKTLKRLYMSCCNTSCSLATKKRLTKGCLRKIRNLSMPGSKIPDWFSQEEVTFKERKNQPIKSVIIGAVVSLDHKLQDNRGHSLSAIVDIQVQILNQDMVVFGTFFDSSGVPNNCEDQIQLYRYRVGDLFFSKLKDGYKIAVTMTNPPYMKGIDLKKWGVHLVYEGDDDYEGEEESLNESQQSISKKLSNFFSTFEEEEEEEEDSILQCNFKEEREVKTHQISSTIRGFSLQSCFIITLSLVFVLFCWLLLAHRSSVLFFFSFHFSFLSRI